ncbi:ribosomal protein L9/RNase H1 isoform X2 [Tasmannia lanceolata]|uniref:ribosomal protein L9/RNase H1 isoform X2 n=1 Tax=Tasmannia lanceolata TaxID=3420 RepID=UPI0040638889
MAHLRCGRSLLRELVKDKSVPNCSCIIHPMLFVGQGIRYRKLEVILTTSIEKLGKAGETVKVAPGYFRNHLMPKLLAVPNIEKYAYLMREQRKLYEREEVETVTVVPKTKEDKMKEYQSAARRLDNARLGLRRFINVDNELRSPVTKDELVAEVARQLGVSIQPENLHLPSPLTTLGEFEVPLKLPKSIPLPEGKLHWSLKVKVRRK